MTSNRITRSPTSFQPMSHNNTRKVFYVFVALVCFALVLVMCNYKGYKVKTFKKITSKSSFFTLKDPETHGCSAVPLRIVVLVMTLPTSRNARNIIRETWMKGYNVSQVNLTVRFVIGTLSVQTQGLLDEHKKHGDLLLLDKLKEKYANLPQKVLMGLRWAGKNLDFDYLVKTDDDMYLRIDVLSQAVQQMNCEKMLYWGKFLAGVPLTAGHNSEKKWVMCDHYLPYAAGGGYVIAERVLKAALPTSERVRIYKNEDVTVGSMLVPFKTKKVHDSRFITHDHSHCINDFILQNVDKREKLREIKAKLSQSGDFCEEGNAIVGQILDVEYEYLPSLRSGNLLAWPLTLENQTNITN